MIKFPAWRKNVNGYIPVGVTSLGVNWPPLVECHRGYANRSDLKPSPFAEAKLSLAREFTRNSSAFDPAHYHEELAPPVTPNVASVSLTPGESARISRLAASHPFFGTATISRLGKTPGDENRTLRSRETLCELVGQLSRATNPGRFAHVDLLLRRDAKSEVSILVDLKHERIDPKMEAFYLAPIDSSVSRSALSFVTYFQPSLVFNNLAESLLKDSPVVADCTDCGRQSVCVPGTSKHILCCNPACAPSHIPPPLGKDFHPGGNRHYYGPAVPNMRNVWIGQVDRFVHQKSRVGIINATIFQLFHDPSVRRPKNVKLPYPDPRVQWTLLPIPR